MGCAFSPIAPANQPTDQLNKNSACIPVCGTIRIAPEKRCKITGCVYLTNKFFVLVDYNNKRVKLFDDDLKCKSFVELNESPFDVCEVGSDIYVTVPKAKLVQKLNITFPMCCVNRKLIKRSTFPTEGECQGIVDYKTDLIVSMKFSTHTDVEIADSSWQIHIMSTSGAVKRKLTHDSDGQALFYDAKYITLTPNKEELVISEGEDNRVKCLNVESGELTYNHHMEDPKGLVCDKHSNIYILGKHGSIRWILADREYVKVLLKGTKSINYSEAIAYNVDKHILAVPRNENKVELYKIRDSILDEEVDV